MQSQRDILFVIHSFIQVWFPIVILLLFFSTLIGNVTYFTAHNIYTVDDIG